MLTAPKKAIYKLSSAQIARERSKWKYLIMKIMSKGFLQPSAYATSGQHILIETAFDAHTHVANH